MRVPAAMAAAVVDDIEYFYDDRIKNFDAERLKITNYIGLIKPNQRELHILQWEGKQEAEAANNMDFELAEYNDDLRRVIKQTIETKLELQSRAQKHIANQSQIQQLGELSQPVLRDITYFFDDKYSLIAPIGVDGRKSSLLTMQKPKITKSMDAQGQAQGQIRGPSRPQAPKPLPKQVIIAAIPRTHNFA